MKTFLHTTTLVLTSLLFSTTVFSQSGSGGGSSLELRFRNPNLESGTAGQDNAVYRFAQVDNDHDALIKIKGRSSSSVELSSIDLSNTGFDKAFQPQVNYSDGSVGSASSWWMEFEVKFVTKNTSTAISMPHVYATGLDIDGDNNTLKEFNTFYGINDYTTESTTSLSVSNILGILGVPTLLGKKFIGINMDHAGIDTLAKELMATSHYLNVSTVVIRVGGATTSSSSQTERMHSIYFKNFSYNAPITLPVKLASFTATLNKNNKAELKWTTASEISVSHFVIERSTDGANYNEAGVVFAYGSPTDQANYIFPDNLSGVSAPIVYYRLRSVDIDGKGQYSETRMIRLSKQSDATIAILTFPNPVTNELRIGIPNEWQNKKVMYEVVNMNGQVTQKTEAASSSQVETINVSNLARGFYMVRVSCEGQTAQQKIVKQ